jgi:predicted RNA-binding Zn-ribbon protein involved in translation (DUF1610 family)
MIDENGDAYGADHADFIGIYLRQRGGRYCSFTCPNCGWPKAEMKMSANLGDCEKCGYRYQTLERIPVSNGSKTEVDYYCSLEVIET